MRYGIVRRAERVVGLAVLAGMATAVGAQGPQTSVTVSTGASVETNPYNEIDSGGASVAATAEIRPLARWRSELSTIDLSGLATFRQFARRYGLEDNYGANANITTRLSEQFTVWSSGGFNYTQGGFNNFGRRGLLPSNPIVATPGPEPVLPLPDPSVIDVAVLGQQMRTTLFNVGFGGSARLGAFSSVSFSTYGNASRFKDSRFGEFNSVGGQVSYNHQLNESLSVGVIANGSRTDYLRTRVGDARTVSLMGSVNYRLGERWSLSGSAGLANTRSQQPLGFPDSKFSSLTAQLGFCRQGEYGRLCFTGSRSPQPSAFGDVRVNNSVQADYSHRLSERETVTVSGSYAHTGRGRGIVQSQPAQTFVSGALRYDKQLRERLTFFTATNFSKITSSDFPRGANFGVNAGLQYRFGAFQ